MQNPLVDITTNLRYKHIEDRLSALESNMRGKTMELIPITILMDAPETTSVVDVNPDHIVFIEDAAPNFILHMSDGTLLYPADSKDEILKKLRGELKKSYVG